MATKRPFPSFLIYRDKEGHWRWNFAGPGGRILAESSQAYTRGSGCVRAIKLLKGSGEIPVVGRPDDMKAVQEARNAGAQAGDEAKPEAATKTASGAAPAAKSGTKKAEEKTPESASAGGSAKKAK